MEGKAPEGAEKRRFAVEVVGCRVTVRDFVEVEALLRCGRGRLEDPASGEGGSSGSSYSSA